MTREERRRMKRPGRPRWSGEYEGKCDVRLDKKELAMLEHLSELNDVTRSDVMRKALRDYYKFNTDAERED